MPVPRILIADDQEEMVRTIALTLANEYDIIGTAEDGKRAIELVTQLFPDILVLREGASLTAEEFETYCRQRIAAYKVPHQVEFVDSLPRNATGKILKRVLRDEANVAVTTG